jgi:hypothetical protein
VPTQVEQALSRGNRQRSSFERSRDGLRTALTRRERQKIPAKTARIRQIEMAVAFRWTREPRRKALMSGIGSAHSAIALRPPADAARNSAESREFGKRFANSCVTLPTAFDVDKNVCAQLGGLDHAWGDRGRLWF